MQREAEKEGTQLNVNLPLKIWGLGLFFTVILWVTGASGGISQSLCSEILWAPSRARLAWEAPDSHCEEDIGTPQLSPPALGTIR